MLIDRLNTLAAEAGIDPEAALNMDFAEFARRVGVARALRDSKRIALAVVARAPRPAHDRHPYPWERGHLWARPTYTTPAPDTTKRRAG